MPKKTYKKLAGELQQYWTKNIDELEKLSLVCKKSLLKNQLITAFELFTDKDIHVFEDSPKNLVIPDQLGWNTVFVHHANPLNTLPSHIHRQTRTTADILREMPQRHRRTVNHLTQTPDLG